MSYELREEITEARAENAIDEISSTLQSLDKTLAKLADAEESGSKIKTYFEQEKAILQIKKILHEARKVEKLGEKMVNLAVDEAKSEASKLKNTLVEIGKNYENLDATLAQIDEAQDPNKVQSAYQQEKADIQTKKLLKSIDKFEGEIEDLGPAPSN